MDAVELDTARQGVRPDKERETAQRLQSTCEKQLNSKMLAQNRKMLLACWVKRRNRYLSARNFNSLLNNRVTDITQKGRIRNDDLPAANSNPADIPQYLGDRNSIFYKEPPGYSWIQIPLPLDGGS